MGDRRPFARALALAACLAMTACATRPGPEVLVPVERRVDGAQLVTIHTATTREREKNGVNRFTAAHAERTNYAGFTISLPPDHRPGQIEWPKAQPDPSTSFAVLDQRILGRDDFIEGVASAARNAERREVSVFVHGYNQNFEQALFRLAQMTADAHHQGASVLFAWPSQAQVAGYIADRDSAMISRDHLVELLTALVDDTRIGDITLVAHSMGAWLAVEALRELRLTGRDRVIGRLQVVLAAPDIDVGLFHAQMKVLGPMDPPMTVLVSPDDRALLVSRRLAGDRDRLGALDITDPRVEVAAQEANVVLIDISSLDASDTLRHGRFAMLGAVYSQLEDTGASSAGQRLQRAGAYVFNAVGATISSPFVLVGDALADQ